jgi:hypothetical protein
MLPSNTVVLSDASASAADVFSAVQLGLYRLAGLNTLWSHAPLPLECNVNNLVLKNGFLLINLFSMARVRSCLSVYILSINITHHTLGQNSVPSIRFPEWGTISESAINIVKALTFQHKPYRFRRWISFVKYQIYDKQEENTDYMSSYPAEIYSPVHQTNFCRNLQNCITM